MKELKKTIHLQNVSDQQKLDVEQLSKVIGGVGADGCTSGVCSNNLERESLACSDSVCSSGVEGLTCYASYERELG